ncbi:MAG TPA: hypothetical protein VH415_02420 [Nitrososphaeraceae archaeon]
MANLDESKILLKLYEIYDSHRESLIWFLEEFSATSYEDYEQRYHGASRERFHFVSVCGFFELSGVLVSRKIVNASLYFDLFNPSPFWNKAKPIIEGMRKKRPHIYERFESLNQKRTMWAKNRKNSK